MKFIGTYEQVKRYVTSFYKNESYKKTVSCVGPLGCKRNINKIYNFTLIEDDL